MNFRLAEATQALAFGEPDLPEDRKAPMRVENGVHVVDVHVNDLIDARGSVVVGLGERR